MNLFNITDSRINASIWDVPVLYGESGDILVDERKEDGLRRSEALKPELKLNYKHKRQRVCSRILLRMQDSTNFPRQQYLKDESQKRALGPLQGNRNSLPVLHVRGSFYEVGLKIGRTFSRIIQNYIETNHDVQTALSLYETQIGKHVYDTCFDTVSRNYPEIVRELRGLAVGSDVPFYKLFLLHMEDIMLLALPTGSYGKLSQTGSTTVMVSDGDTQLLGHVVDSSSNALGNAFIVHAIITECCPKQEFTALSIGGMLPGHTMGYNHHGLVFAVDPIHVKDCIACGIPRSILSRAVLSASSYSQVQRILEGDGSSIGNGMALTTSLLWPHVLQRGFEVYEVGPKYCAVPRKSSISRSTIVLPKYNSFYRTNKYQRLKTVREKMHKIYVNWVRSKLSILKSFDSKTMGSELPIVLGNSSINSVELSNIFTSVESRGIISVAVGIFDFTRDTWSLYLDNPAETEPILNVHIDLI